MKHYIYEHDIDIVALTETWLTPDDKYEALELCSNNAVIHRCDRGSTGGGVAIMCKNEYDSKLIPSDSYRTFEHVMVSINISGKPFRIVCIYRPPKSSPSQFIEEFSLFLENNCLAGDPILLTGDFNIHVDISTDPFTKKFNEILYAFSLKQHIAAATHDKGHTLDLILSRSNDETSIDSTYVGDFLSDHKAVHCFFKLKKNSKDF